VPVVRATQIAVEAETLRLRLLGRRMAVRAVLGALAMGFLVGALVMAHIAVWYWLRVRFEWMQDSTAALLTGADLVLGGVLAMAAMRLKPGTAELEARLIRQQATRSLARTAAWPMILLRVLPLARMMRRDSSRER
jgi:hypothetical protein